MCAPQQVADGKQTAMYGFIRGVYPKRTVMKVSALSQDHRPDLGSPNPWPQFKSSKVAVVTLRLHSRRQNDCASCCTCSRGEQRPCGSKRSLPGTRNFDAAGAAVATRVIPLYQQLVLDSARGTTRNRSRSRTAATPAWQSVLRRLRRKRRGGSGQSQPETPAAASGYGGQTADGGSGCRALKGGGSSGVRTSRAAAAIQSSRRR